MEVGKGPLEMDVGLAKISGEESVQFVTHAEHGQVISYSSCSWIVFVTGFPDSGSGAVSGMPFLQRLIL